MRHIHITPQLVQAVRDAVDIVDIASEYTRLKRSGRRTVGLCPLHKEKTPSFSVDADRGLFYCFGCGQGGDAIRLHMKLSGDDFPGAIETLARRYGIPLPTRRAAPGAREEPDLEPVLAAASEFFRARLGAASGPRAYLERRRIADELSERFGLGYAPPGWRELVEELRPRFSLAELQAAGLIGRSEKRGGEPYDRFRNRLMFPIRNSSGRLVGFGGRALGDDSPKYLNTAETSRFRKGTLLYGLDVAKRAIRETGRVFLVEGYFDVLGAAAAGIEGTVAGMGTALTPEQCRLLSRFADDIVVGYDGDEAGELAFRRALPLLLAQGLGVRRPELGEGHDPDSVRLEHGAERLVALVDGAPDAVARELDRLVPPGTARDPRLQARAAREVAELLRPIGDQVLRFGYGREAAERLGVPVDLLWKRVGDRRPSAERDEPRAARAVRSLEERLLQLLLAGNVQLPPAEELPPDEAFFDPECRNIYRAFCALYKDGGVIPPSQSVLERLGEGDQAVDHVARILLEDPVTAGREEFSEALRQLRRRWQQQRLRLLSTEIGEAQRAGDGARLRRLLDEKTSLSRDLHRGGDA